MFLLLFFCIVLILLFLLGISFKIPTSIWSIKVFRSDSYISAPLTKSLTMPSLQAADVWDVSAQFLADPFIIQHETKYYLFFEVLDGSTGKGLIGLASSNDGEKWNYEKIVLEESFHLSYPYVFKFKNDFFMIPESNQANRILLYKAKEFPYKWEVEKEIIHGKYVDPSIFQFNNKWWMFAGYRGKLHLFFANELFGEWTKHPKSPLIINNFTGSRPAGRVICDDNIVYRYAQVCEPYYGSAVRAFKITTLTESDYEEEELSIVLKGSMKAEDWRKDGMHSIDQLKLGENQWLIAVDGHKFAKKSYLSWKYRNWLIKLNKKYSHPNNTNSNTL